jgi:hypothetical protein
MVGIARAARSVWTGSLRLAERLQEHNPVEPPTGKPGRRIQVSEILLDEGRVPHVTFPDTGQVGPRCPRRADRRSASQARS